MKNRDTVAAERAAILQRFADAVRDNNTDEFNTAFGELADNIQQSVLGDFNAYRADADARVLAQRGVRQLTSEERSYYEAVINAMKGSDPKQALANINTVMPETVLDSVFDNIKAEHPLLSHIRFQNTGALVKILVSTTSGTAAWGTLGEEIDDELSASFSEVDLSLAQLSAFIPVNKYMLELGPGWIDRYVRELLVEAIAAQLEVGIIDGTGKNQPIGMCRALTGAVDGVYQRKSIGATLTSFDAVSYGAILNTLTQGPNGKRRAVNGVILVVNPSDYFTKVFPASTVRTADGGFNSNVFPFPTTVVQSPGVPSGKAVFGIAERYFMGLGTGSGGKIEYSDEYRFLKRERVYLTFLYGYGRPLDDNAFVFTDISGLVPYVQRVDVTNDSLRVDVTNDPLYTTEYEDARLVSLAIGNLTLSPAFDRDKFIYTAPTTSATNTISALAKDGDATIAIKNGNTTVANGSAATWVDGENTVTVTVTNGASEKVYTITVTKT